MSSRAYRLKTEEDAAAGIRRIATGRVEAALERLHRAGSAEPVAQAIHGARKDLKKLRGLLRMVRGELGKKTFKAEDRRYRDACRALSGSRDAEVRLRTLLELRRRFADLPAGDAGRWQARLETERDRLAVAGGELEGKIAAAAAAIEGGREAIRQWPLETDSWALVGPGLAQTYRRGRKAGARVRAKPSTEEVHEWRKRVKDHWYQLRILRDAWPGPLGETADQAHALTEMLGDHHDLAVLAADLATRTELGDGAAFEAAIERRQEELLAAALDLGQRLYAEKPEAFGRRIERYWLAWREA